MGTPETIRFFHQFGSVGIVLLLLAASIAIWKWGAKYKTHMGKVAAVLMIVGIWCGIGVPIGMILAAVGLILMLVARQRGENVKANPYNHNS
jgi:TRAP-type C4-dicarboxylate transport system permease small subunit